MYPSTKLQLIGKMSDLGTKFAPKKLNNKNFGKINIKFEMMIQQYTPAPNFSQSGNFSF